MKTAAKMSSKLGISRAAVGGNVIAGPMSNLLVLDFDGIHTADEVLNKLRSLQKEHRQNNFRTWSSVFREIQQDLIALTAERLSRRAVAH